MLESNKEEKGGGGQRAADRDRAPAAQGCAFLPTHIVSGLGLTIQGLGPRNVQRFRSGLVFKVHRLLYRSTLGSRVIKKKEEGGSVPPTATERLLPKDALSCRPTQFRG